MNAMIVIKMAQELIEKETGIDTKYIRLNQYIDDTDINMQFSVYGFDGVIAEVKYFDDRNKFSVSYFKNLELKDIKNMERELLEDY